MRQIDQPPSRNRREQRYSRCRRRHPGKSSARAGAGRRTRRRPRRALGHDGRRWEAPVISGLIEWIQICPPMKRAPVFGASSVRIGARNLGCCITGDIRPDPVARQECGDEFNSLLGLGARRRHRHDVTSMTLNRPVGQTSAYRCLEPGRTMTTTASGR